MQIYNVKDAGEEVDRGGIFVPQILWRIYWKLLKLQKVGNAALTLCAENGYVESG
jgi:hypothetical protein